MSKDFFVIAHNIRSIHNVGSIFRTADAFGISKIYITGYTPKPSDVQHRDKIAKVALGAEQFVPWEHCRSAAILIKKLKSQHPKITIVGLENNVVPAIGRPQLLTKFKPRFPLALILGEEVKGINRNLIKLCDKLVEIPMQGKKESLNVSVAFGVAAYGITNSR